MTADNAKTYRELIRLIPQTDPPKQIYDHILAAIVRLHVRRQRIRALLYGGLILGAGVSFVPVIQYLGSVAHQSGFFEYLSLVTTDGAYAIGHTSDLISSLADSAPVGAIALLGAVALVFVYSVGRIVAYLPAFRSTYASSHPSFSLS